MGIIIKGMDMPKSCSVCRLGLTVGGACGCMAIIPYKPLEGDFRSARQAWCPLEEAEPTDRIDLQELEDRFGKYVRFVVEDMISGEGKRLEK